MKVRGAIPREMMINQDGNERAEGKVGKNQTFGRGMNRKQELNSTIDAYMY